VTKIEAIGEGDVLASIVIESDLGQIELEVEGGLKTDAMTQDPLIHALDEIKLLAFAVELHPRQNIRGLHFGLVHLSLPDEATE
jgi:hypothetical protein